MRGRLAPPRLTLRRVLAAAAGLLILAVGLLLLMPAVGFADAFSNIAPAAPVPGGGWMGRYPIGRYQLDQYFPAISVGLLEGVDVSGLVPMIAYAAAQIIWLISAFVSNVVITVFGFAFSLNLLTGEGVGGGALAPVAQAIHNIYSSTFGQPWLVVAITCVGVWAMWKALVQRRYAQTTTALLTSLAYCLVALAVVARPAQTITPIVRVSNEMSRAFLSLTDRGTVAEGTQAASAGSGQLFQTLVVDPWTVLEFGGIDHCVNTANHPVPVQPLSRDPAENSRLAQMLEERAEVDTGSKRCVDNRNKYAPHFLAYGYQSPGRNAESQALKAGEDSKLPSSDPGKSDGSYPLGPVDKPAAEAAGKGGQYERLLLSIVILAGEVGVWLLLGSLAAGVIVAQILLLIPLALSPVVLVAAVFPGRGHALFRGWLSKIAGYLARKAVYSLILAILLAVCQALQDATSSLGWLMSFLMQAALCWAIFLQRKHLTSGLIGAVAGGDADSGNGGRLQTLYYATRLTQIAGALRSGNGHATPATAPADGGGGGGGGSSPDGSAPDGNPPPRPPSPPSPVPSSPSSSSSSSAALTTTPRRAERTHNHRRTRDPHRTPTPAPDPARAPGRVGTDLHHWPTGRQHRRGRAD